MSDARRCSCTSIALQASRTRCRALTSPLKSTTTQQQQDHDSAAATTIAIVTIRPRLPRRRLRRTTRR